MEKIKLGLQMSNTWRDPPVALICSAPAALVVAGATLYGCWGLAWSATSGGAWQIPACWAVLPLLITYVLWSHVYHNSGDCGVETEKFVTFNSASLRSTYAHRRIPMCELYEHYCDGSIDFNKEICGGDCYQILAKHRDEFVNYKTTMRQIFWLFAQLFPTSGDHGSGNSSLKDVASTTKEIQEHYDRGNAFFNAFLGNSMVYTSAIFNKVPSFGDTVGYAASAADGTLEAAQFNKMDTICNKLKIKEGEKVLDLGCGWGTLARHAVREFGAKATGVTLSSEGQTYCRAVSLRESTPTEILCTDYREIPEGKKFDKISCIEMAEHVGLDNFGSPFLTKIRGMLEDEGLFLMQVAGLRQGSNWQDVQWGLFMSKYIFPGADASTPLNWYIEQLERAGFEVHHVETIGRHYSHTLHKWYDNWMSKKESIVSGGIDAERGTLRGDRLFRLWEFFLAYSVIASGQGSATCYQIVAHPNTYSFPRDRWVEGETGRTFDYAKGVPPNVRGDPLGGPTVGSSGEEKPGPLNPTSIRERAGKASS